MSYQIIKEKLVFPSGTATAQLISVIHGGSGLDKEGSAPTKRTGYRPLETDEEPVSTEVAEETSIYPAHPGSAAAGWVLLGLSFMASGIMTVRPLASSLITPDDTRSN